MDLRLPLFISLAVLAGGATYFGNLESSDAALLFFTIAFLGVISMFGKKVTQRALTSKDIEMQLRYQALELPKDDRFRVNEKLDGNDVVGAAHELCAALERNETEISPDAFLRLEQLIQSLGLSSDLLDAIRSDGPGESS